MNNFDRKIRPSTRKMIYVSVLPSNHFQTHKHPKGERERERERARRESRESELDRNPTLDASARSRCRDRPIKIAQHEACRHLTGLVAHDLPMTNHSLSRSLSLFEPSLIVATALQIASSSSRLDHLLLISLSPPSGSNCLPHLFTTPHRRPIKHLLHLCMNPIHHCDSSIWNGLTIPLFDQSHPPSFFPGGLHLLISFTRNNFLA